MSEQPFALCFKCPTVFSLQAPVMCFQSVWSPFPALQPVIFSHSSNSSIKATFSSRPTLSPVLGTILSLRSKAWNRIPGYAIFGGSAFSETPVKWGREASKEGTGAEQQCALRWPSLRLIPKGIRVIERLCWAVPIWANWAGLLYPHLISQSQASLDRGSGITSRAITRMSPWWVKGKAPKVSGMSL